ncbi:MAG: 1-acyl-sn-glycerol-3-phosphate acyltransferase [Planctomycetes bacterium]|nr:1-acyl-sn-glycerol-3-phosphate acyltransferase [Planctomycetota bacterium]
MLDKIQWLWYKLVIAFGRSLAICFFRFRVYGHKNVPVRGGALIAANHQSFLDPPFIAFGLNRNPYFLARQELFEFNWIFKILILAAQAIPLERRVYDSKGIRRAIALLKKGGLLLVFPEGGRGWTEELRTPKGGMILLARKAGVPIIPTIIDGSFKSWSRRETLPGRLAPIKVVFGRPVRVNLNDASKDISNKIYQSWTELKNFVEGVRI